MDLYCLKAPRSTHVSRYAADMLESALEETGFAPLQTNWLGVPFQLGRLTLGALYRAGLIRNIHVGRGSKVLAVLMGPEAIRLFPVGVLNRCALYCYDCWPGNFDKWELLFRRFRTDVAFFSASSSAKEFAKRISTLKTYWIPEATDPLKYFGAKELKDRAIDVLELGRRFASFHEAVVSMLAAARRCHLYESVPGRIIFPTLQGLLNGLGDSKILICYPASMTHPERAGKVETVTHRYFEGMASRCLLAGHAPQELIELFGYNPVIEISPASAAERVADLLGNISSFQSLVDRNYKSVIRFGSWLSRSKQMREILVDHQVSDEARGIQISAALRDGDWGQGERELRHLASRLPGMGKNER